MLTTAFSVTLHPRIVFAEGAREEIIDHHSSGGLLAINASHQNITDQSHLALLTRRDPEVFGHLEGIARIMAKYPIFKTTPLRAAVEELGAFPVIRYKDLVKILDREPNEEELAKLKKFQSAAVDASISMINKGQDFGNFPEGTRDADNTRIKEGMGKIAVGVSNEVDLALLPVGFYFPKFKVLGRKNIFRPTMYIDNLIKGPFTDVENVSSKLQASIVHSVQEAKNHTPCHIYRNPK